MTGPEYLEFLTRHGWTVEQFGRACGIARSTSFLWARVGPPAPVRFLCRLIDAAPDVAIRLITGGNPDA